MRNDNTVDEKACGNWFDQIAFQHPLRHYQQDIISLCNQKLEAGERELHIVAPPGSGKTIIGLQIVSQFKCATLVVCPNTTIQAQWAKKLHFFFPDQFAEMAAAQMIGDHQERPLKPITIVTYQALSVPERETEYLSELAQNDWCDEIMRAQSVSQAVALARIEELKTNNRQAYRKEMSRHTARRRRHLGENLDLTQVLHKNALQFLENLKQSECGLVIFDECHHLTDYWAAVMKGIVDQLNSPVIVGLTGTPPEGKTSSQQARYLKLVGSIDYQVPTPALVKDGGLAPFQDLVFFTQPTARELEFLQRQHAEIHELLDELSDRSDVADDETGSDTEQKVLAQWIINRTSPETGETWSELVARSPALAMAIARFLYSYKLPLPKDLAFSSSVRQSLLIDDWMCLLEDFALNSLKVSTEKQDIELLERISQAIRRIGFGLSENGIRKIASPVDRVLSFSDSKSEGVEKILSVEYQSLEDRLRALVITDFEKLSATANSGVKGILDQDCGSAFGAFVKLLASDVGQYVNPCMVTGTKVLVDARIADDFLEAAREYLVGQQLQITLAWEITDEQSSYRKLKSGSGSLTTSLYVPLVTELFERGITKCLIGTRGIFGEGWDSQRLNTMIDLTTSTSSVSVKQLRGRGIRLLQDDSLEAKKVANNWDVVCIAPELEKGLNDYQRFVRKHAGYFGIADDGNIECGVGHVHPSFSELTANEVFESIDEFNTEMLSRAVVREKIYDLWQVGQPYGNKQLGCVEIAGFRTIGIQPPHIRVAKGYAAHARQLRGDLQGIWTKSGAVGLVLSAASTFALTSLSFPVFLAAIPILGALLFAKRRAKLFELTMESELLETQSADAGIRSMAMALFYALQERKFLPEETKESAIKITVRSDMSFRVFLDDVEPRHSDLFVKCFEELLTPISNQPYIIAKYEFSTSQCQEPNFFRRYIQNEAKPEIGSYHAVPKLLARSEKGRDAFQYAWNNHVSPGFVEATEDNDEVLQKYFGMGPSLAERLLWE